jgi:pimeloyl-ACP methyl ester carboxylesterase
MVIGSASAVANELSVGTYLSVTCAENLVGVTREQAEQATAGTFLGMARVGPVLRACAFWPRGAVSQDFHTPVRSDVPVLLLSGTMDPATPVEWVERVRATLPNARSVVVPGGAHGVGDVGCVPGLVARFLDDPSAALDTSCVGEVPTRFARSLAAADRR